MGKEQVNVRERSKPEALELATDAELPGQIVEGNVPSVNEWSSQSRPDCVSLVSKPSPLRNRSVETSAAWVGNASARTAAKTVSAFMAKCDCEQVDAFKSVLIEGRWETRDQPAATSPAGYSLFHPARHRKKD